MLKINLESSQNGNDKKKKKQKLVKHKRKNWSKTDISEVEKGIDELRQEQLSGGVRAEQKDEDLFYISKQAINEPAEKKRKLSLKEKMENLNCYRNLKPDVNSLPAINVSSKQKPDKLSKRQIKLKEKKLETKKKLIAKKKKNIATSSNLLGKNESLSKKKTKVDVTLNAEFEKDLWNSSELPEITHTNEHYLRGKKLIPIKKPENPLRKTKSAIPAVEVPHPGTSYNPDYDDHQDLLLKAHLVELKKLKQEEKLMRQMAANAKKMSWQEIESLWLEEMSCKDLFDTNKDEKSEEEQDEEENGANSIKKVSKRSLKKLNKKSETREKRKRRKLLEKIKQRQLENEKKMRIQQNEIYRLKSLKNELKEKEAQAEEKKLLKEIENKHKELFETKRLGSLKFEEPELELKLSDELTGNLRTLKPEGNILTDRYKSLQKRNILEPRQLAKKERKYSKKVFSKRNAYEVTHYIK